MSAMGQLAARVNSALWQKGIVTGRALVAPPNPTGDQGCTSAPDCFDDEDGPAGGQAETSIAIDATGQHVVIGFNDTRDFARNPISVSGFFYSDDGGKTFVDGGQLPSPGTDVIGTTKLPQVFVDPDVKYLGACTFIYSSILVAKFSNRGGADHGHSPLRRLRAHLDRPNPNGFVDQNGNPVDAADKEFIDVNRASGRLMIGWTRNTSRSIRQHSGLRWHVVENYRSDHRPRSALGTAGSL